MADDTPRNENRDAFIIERLHQAMMSIDHFAPAGAEKTAILTLLRSLIGDDIEQPIKTCPRCRLAFRLTVSEITFYVRNSLHIPKFCAACRKARRDLHVPWTPPDPTTR